MSAPTIIIGAGRSGTNALRDALCTLRDFHTWPCDEINYIWRHGNKEVATDQFSRSHARPEVASFIREAFAQEARKDQTATLVEKTCANSLRVGFVHEVFPEAQFVHITRDGRDVAASAIDRWTAPLDVPYLAAKARYVPKTDLPYYASRYLGSRVAKVRSSEDRLSWWGPKFEGMEHLTPETPLVEVAARQWERCVALSVEQLALVPQEQVLNVRYSDLVEDPRNTLATITEFLGKDIGDSALSIAANTIRAGSVGKWRSALSAEQIEMIAPIVDPALAMIGLNE